MHPISPSVQLLQIVKEVAPVLGGGLHVEYSTASGLFLSYRDKTPTLAHIQDAMYADDMAHIAESRSELQHMLTVLDEVCERWGCVSVWERLKY